MTVTLEEARNLKPGVHVVHFGDEDVLYIVKAVFYGWDMPVKVLVERYPEHIEGHETFFTEHQLHMVTMVGEAKADEATEGDTRRTPEETPGASQLSTPQQTPERPSEAWQRAYQYQARDTSAGASGDEARATDSPTDTSLEVPGPEETGPDQGRSVREDLKQPPRRKYKRG